ncbi:Ig-like domain-containing protein, partial [Aeromonas veronii]|uniref:Ig-like domain-containing protein n=1 Tax=Aeromonas veronii TaxID=654 RepID=UPI001573158E
TFSSDVQITAGNMTVEADNAQADGVAKNKVQVKVTRADGNAVENEPVTFTADNGASLVGSNPVTTDASGIAVIELTSTVIGQSSVTATLSNGATQSKAVTFSSDVQITAGNMTVEADNAQADGVAKNKVQVKVTRADGSVVENEPVTF